MAGLASAQENQGFDGQSNMRGPDAPPPGSDEGGFFFRYLPAAPDLKLPKIRITPFWTDDLKKAKRAYNDGNYPRALRLFRRESEDGNAVADWYLGHMYRLGRGVPEDDAIAYSYYQRVAENYDPDEQDYKRLQIMVDSQIWMASYLRTGIPGAGVDADPQQAARTYLRLASTYGHPEAMFALGVMNIKGEGVKQNPQQGLKWLTAAARKRHAGAEAYLGDLYWKGGIVKQDHIRALMWYTLASETANRVDDSDILSRYARMRDGMEDDERLEAEARARVWSDQYPASVQN
ncbi:MAG: tetratricopeptide repeat protein [Hyphomicrobiales bacterium]